MSLCASRVRFGGAQSPVDGVLEGSAGRGALRFAKEQLFGLLAERDRRRMHRVDLGADRDVCACGEVRQRGGSVGASRPDF